MGNREAKKQPGDGRNEHAGPQPVVDPVLPAKITQPTVLRLPQTLTEPCFQNEDVKLRHIHTRRRQFRYYSRAQICPVDQANGRVVDPSMPKSSYFNHLIPADAPTTLFNRPRPAPYQAVNYRAAQHPNVRPLSDRTASCHPRAPSPAAEFCPNKEIISTFPR
ncbi:uncharacterized protein CIMG_02409 [Coccidioides immitis RS]|uniref:Uncharacterized protein n=3 Tax=Coccidioides immitis TaxID=5501 RepID=J3KLB5_COCIM|nr:uncharacterized protein CIMG_02409 [Coccidioides immitis RS]EAS37055.3 hypothetical protein CIMG_02409 [Coccidioides immitis RS]KMP09988.1 hypothetical protein CIRG_09221 [Coccidioides immitis RMSCC 2394]KMU81119.1 hypothetical protein CISG_02497 [Coccidioides immitis RMSCC 3703]